MVKDPLVSVVCLCHNQADFVTESLQSIVNQTYKNVEIIIVDDASSDHSRAKIEAFIEQHEVARAIFNPSNLGNCASFNLGFRTSRGKFLIDLAADDVLKSERIAKGVEDFEKYGSDFGVHFSNAVIINSDGEEQGIHHDENAVVPSGDIYENLITTYFVNPATMMIRREVLDDLNGYDESLSYEDFDFWIRSSRRWKYIYHPDQLVLKRIVKGSLSSRQFRFFNRHQQSTLVVCRKIKTLNRNSAERSALKRRALYEMRQAVRFGNLDLIPGFVHLYLTA